MATQRITIAKIAGDAGEHVHRLLSRWYALRKTDDPDAWSWMQWPEPVGEAVEKFANLLRAHGAELPVVHFVEWIDHWSMGDLFDKWLIIPGGPTRLKIFGRHEVYGYPLPDGGKLRQHLRSVRRHQFPEYRWFVRRLAEAVDSWEGLVDRSTLVVLRGVLGATVLDEEVEAARGLIPEWLESLDG